jgi:zinc finger BED domain-containing protein 1 (E3 SUMO-protein ligase ZBED1)
VEAHNEGGSEGGSDATPEIEHDADRAAAAAGEDSETDNDEDVSALSVNYVAIQHLRDSVRDEVDAHVEEETTPEGKAALDAIRAKVALFRRIATYFRRSPKAKYRLTRIQKPRPALGLILDCPTRWSSAHAMLARFETIKTDILAFFSYLQTTAGSSEFSDAVLSEIPGQEDWFYIRCLGILLQPFADVTAKLSGENYSKFVIAFPFLRMIQQYLHRKDLFDKAFADVATEPFARSVLTKMQLVRTEILVLFTKRFKSMDDELMWVPLLDPRVADMSYLQPHEVENAKECLVEALLDLEGPPPPSTPEPEQARPEFLSPLRGEPSVIDMFEAQLYGKQHEQPVQVPDAEREEQRRVALKAEAFNYLTAAQQKKTSQLPLDWWRENAYRFPSVSLLAKKWLACPATSVPSERAFSTAGNIVTVKRASLTAGMVENLTILAHN